jgi:hypothetical protein
MTDAAQGKGNRKTWGALADPSCGRCASLRARCERQLQRKTKKVASRAKARASELPNDLMNRAEQVSE